MPSPAHRGALGLFSVWYLAHHLHSEPSNRFLFYSERKTEFFLEPVSLRPLISSLPLPSLPPPPRPLAALLVLRTFALLKCTSSNHFLTPRITWQYSLTHQRCNLPPCIICLLSAYNDLISHTSYPLIYSVSAHWVNIFFILLSFLLCPQNWEAGGCTINIC